MKDWGKRWDYLYDTEDIPGIAPTQEQHDHAEYITVTPPAQGTPQAQEQDHVGAPAQEQYHAAKPPAQKHDHAGALAQEHNHVEEEENMPWDRWKHTAFHTYAAIVVYRGWWANEAGVHTAAAGKS
ncbi:hypothetical protein V6N13_001482 [Hibiscus sabdariffa]